MMHKKGLIPLTIPFALAIIVLFAGIVAIIAFVSSATLRYALIGISVLVAVVFLFSKTLISPKKTERSTWIVLLVMLGIGVFFISGNGILQEFVSGSQYIQVPAFGYYECAPSTVKSESPWNDIGSTGSGFIITPKNSDNADLIIRVATNSITSTITTDYQIVTQKCPINNGVCEQQNFVNLRNINKNNQYYYLNPINVLKSEKVWIDFQKRVLVGKWTNIIGSQFEWKYNPFIIWKVGVFNIGGKTPLTGIKEGCVFGDYKVNTGNLLVSETLDNVNVQQTSLSNAELQPYQTRGFVENLIPISVENRRFVTHSGQNGYCTNNAVYKIEEVRTSSQIYKVVRIDSIPVSSVTCCPGDNDGTRTCTANFQWQTITTDTKQECSAFNQCPISNWQESPTPNTLVIQRCVNNLCVSETKEVQCTRDSSCMTGQACDLTLNKCVNVPGGTILDEEKINSAIKCEQKAKDQPFLGWTWVEKSESSCGLNPLCSIGITSPKTTTTGECKASFAIYYWLIGFIVVLAVAIYFVAKRKR